eukprot:2914299-Rhodomonas_salina.2
MHPNKDANFRVMKRAHSHSSQCQREEFLAPMRRFCRNVHILIPVHPAASDDHDFDSLTNLKTARAGGGLPRIGNLRLPGGQSGREIAWSVSCSRGNCPVTRGLGIARDPGARNCP